jgi:hypothetical protein
MNARKHGPRRGWISRMGAGSIPGMFVGGIYCCPGSCTAVVLYTPADAEPGSRIRCVYQVIRSAFR